jgi:hypothetical protein
VRIVLLLDEMDQFMTYSPDVQGRLRSLFNTRIGSHLKMVMAGVSTRFVPQTLTSPWFNLFQRRIELQTLDETAAQQLIVEPVLGYYTYPPKALKAILEYSDLKPLEIQRLASFTVNEMLRRIHLEIEPVQLETALGEILIEWDDVLKATRHILQEKDEEYRERWAKFSAAQRKALRQALSDDVMVDIHITRPDGALLFSREDLYNIACLEDNYVRLTYLFKEWLRGVS